MHYYHTYPPPTPPCRSPREMAGDYDVSRYRTIYGSPRPSSSEEEGPIYNEDEEGDSEGGSEGE